MKHMEEQISFLKKIIVRDDFSLEQQEKYRTQMEVILKRKNQKNLQIAIVGEFSSGKSTLINAMIGKNLLKTAFMATHRHSHQTQGGTGTADRPGYAQTGKNLEGTLPKI
ncbi:MAG: dynamin family protein [Lachnospiraceae bacterium]